MSNKYQKNADGLFICTHCTFTAKYQSTMHYHLAKHEGSLPYKCKYCSQRFVQKGILDLHYTLHHEDKLQEAKKPSKLFKCPIDGCDYENAQKGNTVIHFLRIHMKEQHKNLKEKSKQEGCQAHCKKCETDFKSNTQFYYPTHACVVPSQNSSMYEQWKAIS
jgi:hypothetical protein